MQQTGMKGDDVRFAKDVLDRSCAVRRSPAMHRGAACRRCQMPQSSKAGNFVLEPRNSIFSHFPSVLAVASLPVCISAAQEDTLTFLVFALHGPFSVSSSVMLAMSVSLSLSVSLCLSVTARTRNTYVPGSSPTTAASWCAERVRDSERARIERERAIKGARERESRPSHEALLARVSLLVPAPPKIYVTHR